MSPLPFQLERYATSGSLRGLQRCFKVVSLYCLKCDVSIMLHCQLCSTCYAALRIKNCSESISICIQSSHYEKYGRFPLRREATAKSTPFPISKDEWDAKEDTGKSMNNALYLVFTAVCRKAGVWLKRR